MLIAYMIIKLLFLYRMIRAAFVGLDGNMEEAAQAIWNEFWFVAVNGVNSNEVFVEIL